LSTTVALEDTLKVLSRDTQIADTNGKICQTYAIVQIGKLLTFQCSQITLGFFATRAIAEVDIDVSDQIIGDRLVAICFARVCELLQSRRHQRDLLIPSLVIPQVLELCLVIFEQVYFYFG
jgi:hypothetical protein